nr:MAG TPA: hypothetical protein [Caudoviricetes sp.]
MENSLESIIIFLSSLYRSISLEVNLGFRCNVRCC